MTRVASIISNLLQEPTASGMNYGNYVRRCLSAKGFVVRFFSIGAAPFFNQLAKAKVPLVNLNASTPSKENIIVCDLARGDSLALPHPSVYRRSVKSEDADCGSAMT